MENQISQIPTQGIDINTDVTTWALPEGAIARLERGGVCDMAFSPDGHYLVVATKIGIWWYEMTTMSPVALWDTERGMVSGVAFSPNGKWIAASNWDNVLKVWDVQRGVCMTQIELGFWILSPFLLTTDGLLSVTVTPQPSKSIIQKQEKRLQNLSVKPKKEVVICLSHFRPILAC